jgi:hypothetical protein
MIVYSIKFIFLLYFNLFGLNNSFAVQKVDKDTITTREVVPGVKYYHYIKKEYPWSIDVVEIDLKRSNLTFETMKGKDKIVDSRETVTGMVNRKTLAGSKVIAAINADFFDMKNGDVISSQISNFEFVKGIRGKRSQIGITETNIPYIDKFQFSGKIYCKNKKSIDISAVNVRRGKDSLVFYNHFWGTSTRTNSIGKEVAVKPINGWKVNEDIKMVVINYTDSNATVNENNGVISAGGSAGEFIKSNVKIGDTLIVFLGTSPSIKKLKELIGGLPQIIDKGKDISPASTKLEGGGDKFVTTRHPRTAVGFNKDKTRLYFVVVDGRQQTSVGMSLPELSDFMLSIGCFEALNLDGGGSTTMVLENKIVNRPSDLIGERTVGNAVLLIEKNHN